MKNKILCFLLLCLVLLPFEVSASEKTYKTMNFEEILTEEKIEHDLTNYKETDDQAIIYLFRGTNCGYCQRFLTFLNSIVDDYGKYFKVVSYEVWYDSNNAELMNEVAEFLGTKAEGVPFIVIGEQVFPGYTSSYDDAIKEAIMEQYESKNSYDVFNEMSKKKTNKTEIRETSSTSIIIWNLVFISVATIIVLVYVNSKNKTIIDELKEIKMDINQKHSKENSKNKR